VTDVLELLEPFAHPLGLQIRRQPLEDLDAGTLVKEKQVRRWVAVQSDEAFHLGKEVGVGDVKEVAGLVWLQPVAVQNTLYRGLAGRCPDHGSVRAQTACGPSQRPSSGLGQRLGLAVKRHNTHLAFLPVEGWAT